jgi:hypothetical protein
MSLIHILKIDEIVSMSIFRKVSPALVVAGFIAVGAVHSEASETEAGSSVVIESQALASEGNALDAIALLRNHLSSQPNAFDAEEALINLLISNDFLSEASTRLASLSDRDLGSESSQTDLDSRLNRILMNDKIVTVFVQKRIELQDFDTAILILDRALPRYPARDADFYTLKGEALYKKNDLPGAEEQFREALKLNPLNPVAKAYVSEIRSTLEAQTSTAWAEFVSIAKDKFGDFVVTFLALLTAFIFNSAFAPLWMRYRLFRARRAFVSGDYDDFADAIEALLDQEDFSPLRENFRILLKSNSYESIKEIFEYHIMTADRLPTLLRILEREHEKLNFSTDEIQFERRQSASS